MSFRRWKLGVLMAMALSLCVALAGLSGNMGWKSFLAVLGASLVTHFGAWAVQHPVEQITFDGEGSPAMKPNNNPPAPGTGPANTGA